METVKSFDDYLASFNDQPATSLTFRRERRASIALLV